MNKLFSFFIVFSIISSSIFAQDITKVKAEIEKLNNIFTQAMIDNCLLYTSPSPRDRTRSRMPSSA